MSLKLPRNWDFSTFKVETARIVRSKSTLLGEGSPGPTPGSRRSFKSMEKPLKAGWLKKQQKSLVKNWHQRYLVLRGSTLSYHKDDRETTVLGLIQLQFSKVNELPLNTDEPGKYIFEIIPASTNGDKERCPHVFMASSQTEMDEWLRTLRRVIGVPNGVFGKSLSETVMYEQRFGPQMVPILVQKCVEYIREHGLNEEGIFRLPGQDNAVKQFRDAFDAGERPSFPSDTDVHTVASLLKLYLRELPEPVVPWSQYQDFLDCTNMLDSGNKEGREKLEKQIALLPRMNYNLLSYVCRFLFEVQLNSNINKMNVENLATVMGINLLKPQLEDPISVMKATPHIQKLMTEMIRQHEDLFPVCNDEPPSPLSNKSENNKNSPRNFVGWGSTEMSDTSFSESTDLEKDDSPGLIRGNCSSPVLRQDSMSSSDNWSGSPRKRTQTLPNFNCPLTGMAAKAGAITRWSRVQELEEDKSGTLSEDIFKILDLRSSGSFLKGSSATIKETEGNYNKASTTINSPQTERDSQPALTGRNDEPLTGSVLSQVVNNRTEEKKDSQKSLDSVQQELKELRATVVELRCTLEAERRRVSALEICLRNAERSRDEAHRRNEELQRDIQQFLT
ncbi:rho GTPase-activating protein 25 isoform X1 [Corythoichthys intestinalis]|uniref:rho GTPase-activating protein 25 isoform X1 n=2 Tax=Corythoichthys intestinalis TaxID=161448 RepID=UPI0025A60F96|nr:rho GTPase-activating protein 25 isoform X1 [Corythoichthys intestinalis]